MLPFAALPQPDVESRFLGERVDVALLPMAGVPPRRAVQGPVLLGGEPGGDDAGRFAALPRTRLEIDGIEALWSDPRTQTLRGDAFEPDRFVGLPLGDFGVIHLATHALASTLDPRSCAVLFDRGERLGFDRILELELGPSLVVLSACRSGEGETIPGQGVVGLGWAFLVAGAQQLAISLWSIDDAAASDLMIEFHSRLRDGDDPVRALASAQRTLREERPHPAYWAPFVVYLKPAAD